MTRRHFIQTTLYASALAPWSRAEESTSLWSRSEPQMGCLWTLTLPDLPSSIAAKAADAVFSEIARLNQIFTDYEPTSELNQLCAKAGQEAPVVVSAELFNILESSQSMAAFSGGIFDITLGPCIKLWRRSRRQGQLPEAEALAKARDLTGWQHLTLDAASSTARLGKPGMQLDLGGIAKGWTQDACLKLLRERFAISAVLLDAAGQVAAGTPPAGRDSWKIALQAMPGATSDSIPLREANVATSGDHYQFVEIAGQRYSHLIDPRTGLGSTISRQASVIASSGVLADSLTKICCLLEPEASLGVIQSKYPAVQVRITQSRPDGPSLIRQTTGFPVGGS